MGQRALWAVIGIIGTIMSGIGAQLLYQELNAAEAAVVMLGAGAGLAILGIIMAAFGYRTLLMTQREKKG